MMDDLKNYRVPRSPWPWIVAVAALVSFLTYVGPAHFADDLEAEAELKMLRVVLAERAPQPRAQPSPLGNLRCAERFPDKQQWVSTSADGEPWLGRCIDADLTGRKR